MGVINLTPDSFSDGQANLTTHNIQSKIEACSRWADIVDFGAQSTAPFNNALSEDEELERFEKLLFPILKDNKSSLKNISIDTYYPKVFDTVYCFIKKYCENANIIFNDVSGIIDDSVINLLKKYPDVSYVLNHCHVQSRSKVLEHATNFSALEGEAFLDELIENMKDKRSHLKQVGNKIIIDPGFGFSKTRSQNHYLLKHIDRFTSVFYEHEILIGISRKSFMRFPADMDPKLEENQHKLDSLAALVMQEINNKLSSKIIYRSHSNASFELIDQLQNLV